MDRYRPPEVKIGGFTPIPMRGGMITVRDRPTLQFGEKSLVQNMRNWHPGFETRKGYTKLNTTEYNDSADSPLNIYQFVKGKVDEKHLFVQFGDTKLLEAINAPPATGTTFGTEVFDGSANQLPASFTNINDYMVFSNGADQHKIYAGKTQGIEAFVVVRDSAAHEIFPDMGQDYWEEVSDGDSSTVAVLDSLADYDQAYDSIYFMTKTPADKINITIAAANGNSSTLKFEYWNGAWTEDSITDGTSSGGATFAQTGTIVCDTTAVDRTDEIPRYMFNQSGFWYKLSLNPSESAQDLTTYTVVDEDSDLTVTSSKVTVSTMRRDANTYMYKDFGAGAIGDCIIDFEVEVTASSDANATFLPLSICDTLPCTKDDLDTANEGIALYLLDQANTHTRFYLNNFADSDNDTYDRAGTTTPLLYITFTRIGTAVTVDIYTDSARTSLLDTIAITGAADTKRYLAVMTAADSAAEPADTYSGYAQNYVYKEFGSFDANVEVSEVTYDCESFVSLVNVWNGVAAEIIEAQKYDQSLDVWDTYGSASIVLDDMTSSDELYISSANQLEAIYFDMQATPNQTGATTVTVKYWDGSAWQNVTESDGTTGLSETGWLYFGRQTGEFKRQFKDTRYFAYWYQITVDKTLSSDVTASVLGMPYFNIATLGSIGRVCGTWKNRALYTFNKFPRDLYVSQAADHMKLNGTDFAILQPGDGRDNATVACANFHNEIMVFQQEKGARGGCVTVFEGYSPATFGKLVLSTRIGTFSPKTVAVVDGSRTSTTNKELNAQSMVFFLSHYGVFMSDGKLVTGISDDIQNYFDPRFAECIRKGYESEMWLEYDSTENVIKIGIVSGSSATTCNKFFVLDLSDGVWYEDVYADSISVFRDIESDSGQFHTLQVSAGSTTGFVYQMNNGTNDDGAAIEAEIRWEFSHGPYFIEIEEILTRVKAQGTSKQYTWTTEENDVAVDTKTDSFMEAAAVNQTITRNRHLQKAHNIPWVSFTITANTLDVPIYIYDMAVLANAIEYK